MGLEVRMILTVGRGTQREHEWCFWATCNHSMILELGASYIDVFSLLKITVVYTYVFFLEIYYTLISC